MSAPGIDETNPNHYLGPGEQELIEADYAAWYAIHGDDDSAFYRTSGENIWKWAAIMYKPGIRPNGLPPWIKVNEAKPKARAA